MRNLQRGEEGVERPKSPKKTIFGEKGGRKIAGFRVQTDWVIMVE